ncbi:MAG TPA: glycoside hydrolase family 2 TIM barrel-domain containing protein [Longimicrobiaceae bacterium]|nr:glycoside hydrolase family 2 TIM barrel-domain containing protein [Longimicrobiaceae bacterium]
MRQSVLQKAAVSVFLLGLAAQPLRAQSQTSLSLDGTWQFALAPTERDADALAGFYGPGFDTSSFRETPVPSNWALEGYEQPQYKLFEGNASEGFYLKHFTVPAGWTEKRVLLHFGGVWSSAEVWLNGKRLGRHDSGFTSFAYDVTSELKPGAENVLAVRVRQTQHDYEFDANDDWSLGGIYRDVSLEAMPKYRWLDRVDAQTTFDDQFRDADLKVRVMVGDAHKSPVPGNYVGGDEPYELRLTLLDEDGKEVQSRRIAVPPHYATDRETRATLHVESPLHWTAETPNLYTLRVDLLEKGKVSHERELRVGFRQISTEGGVFRVNGQAVKLRGVNRHDEYPDVGRATTRAQWLQDITLMKAANINFVRTSHYPPAAGFLDLCDSLGLYVDDEVPMGSGGNHLNDPAYDGAIMLRSYETVARDIDHPSIILWSIGNEDPLTTLHMAAIRTVKGLDPTRPVLMPWRADEWLPPEIDILAPHYYTAEGYDELAGRSSRPIVSTEYSHSYGTDRFGGLEDRWKALTRHPAGAGAAIWMWADQGLVVTTRKPDGSVEKSLKVVDGGWDGIVDSYRHPTRDYWETKAVYAQVYPAVDRVSFVPGQASVEIPIQNDFDFTDLSAVKIGWALMEDARQLAAGTASIEGQPHASALFNLPVSAIEETRPGATYYAWLTFSRADGSEITRRAVELVDPTSRAVPVHAIGTLSVQKGDDVSVRVGDVAYTFDPRSGQLVSAGRKGTPLISDARPTIWLSSKSGKDAPDLNRYTPSVSEWRVKAGPDTVTLHAVVDYVVDARNRFRTVYDYAVDASGRLKVHYSISPSVQVERLPFVGMSVSLAPALEQLRWLGLGPYDSYPNKKAAAILGVWSGAVGSDDVTGVKATRWVELTGSPGTGARIVNHGYISSDAEHPRQLRVLSTVAGRKAKGRGPEDPAQQLNAGTGQPFVGEFSISPNP